MQPTNFTNLAQYHAILPEIVLLLLGLGLLLVEMLFPGRRTLAAGLTVAGLLLAGVALAAPWEAARVLPGSRMPFLLGFGDARIAPHPGDPPAALLTSGWLQTHSLGFFGNVALDGLGVLLRAVILAGTLLVVLMSWRYAARFRNPSEFFALVVFATLAAMLLCSAADLVLIYLGIEFLSLTSYVLVGYLKFQPRSTEAALKYFLYGAIAAAVMLYGMTFLYGATGTTNLYAAPTRLALGTGAADLPGGLVGPLAGPAGTKMLLIATVLMLVGFGFKAGAVPFHQWIPDVYDAAPTPVMAWLSVASKTAGFAVLLRVLLTVLPEALWLPLVTLMAALTMTLGNLVAIAQTNVKRMLAYSSIGHAGYLLMGVAALARWHGHGSWAVYSVPIYLATYLFMNLGALAVVVAVYEQRRSHLIADYAGLGQTSPGLAWLLVFFLLSLAGIPPTAGFFGKLGLFWAAIESGLLWLAILALLMTVVSVYYYFGVVRAMFLTPPPAELAPVRTALSVRVALALSLAGTVGLFLLAQPLLALLEAIRP